ncbi:MAG: ATP-binding cassette domain-containing protein [Bacteroides sp.]|nr:ATP-binding cassette domain-containing protein [Prevotella sp.]MCM1406882.1 ATP-binding cassette domain-containing protein [Treponema brennaborense]MCM1470033.1 ATP-binding cassette domain-containing protein [Bacteroides sp.]
MNFSDANNNTANTGTALEIISLKKRFNLEAGFFAKYGKFVYAVNDVSFRIAGGETYGLAGESGCGKTTLARLIIRMYEADSGSILYTPQNEREAAQTHQSPLDVRTLSGAALKKYRERVKYIFQDPARSLNPRMTIYDILTAGIAHSQHKTDARQLRAMAEAILEEIGLSARDANRHPSDFSGGQRQRISIARALLMHPQTLICDEIVSALDVSVQGQILNLLQEIRSKYRLSMLFIAHDLKTTCYFCDRIGVMYKGMLVEEAPAADFYKTAQHPYTKTLFAGAGFAAEPDTAQSSAETHAQTPQTSSDMRGCPFAHRCRFAEKTCFDVLPELTCKSGSGGTQHKVRCHKV